MQSNIDHNARRTKLDEILKECGLTHPDLAKELSKAGHGHVSASEVYYLLFRNTVLAAPFRNCLLDLGFPEDCLPPEAAPTS